MSSRFTSILRSVSQLTVYFSMPAFNLAWLRKFNFAEDFLDKNPLIVVDVGSRDGSCAELTSLSSFCEYIGFDADEESVNNDVISPNLSRWKKARIYNYFIGTKNGVETFNLYVRKSESSLLEPNENYQVNFSARLRVESKVKVNSVILGEILREIQVAPDLIKLDTQGTEYEVITSSQSIFSDTLMVEVEAEFLEMYKNQKLFADVSSALYDTGHQLLYLNRVFGNMNNGIVRTRGQLVFADMLFGLNYERARELTVSRKYKYCILLMNYGHNDFAFQLFKTDEIFQSLHPELQAEFEKLKRSRFWNRIKLLCITQLDKIAFVYLAIRRTNGLHFDSDRSWPIR